MFTLELKTFVCLDDEGRKTLPEIVYIKNLHNLSTRIKRYWRKSNLYHLNAIRKYVETDIELTSDGYIKYIYYNIEIDIDNIISILHEFFMHDKSLSVNGNFLHKLSDIIKSKVNIDNAHDYNAHDYNAHDYFCILNTILRNPKKIIINYKDFQYVFSVFSRDILKKLCQFI
jgi:hypothetical protein